jgi:rRNA processing protein Krr1/Pno1
MTVLKRIRGDVYEVTETKDGHKFTCDKNKYGIKMTIYTTNDPEKNKKAKEALETFLLSH